MPSRITIRLVLVVLVCVGAVSCGQRGDLNLSLVSDDARGLEAQAPVYVSGVKIGEVTQLDFNDDADVVASVVILEAYRKQVTRDAKFRIRVPDENRPGMWIEVEPGDAEPADNNAIFEVEVGLMDRVSNWTRKQVDQFKNSDANERLQEFQAEVDRLVAEGKDEFEKRRPELEAAAKDLVESISETSEEAARKAQEELEGILERAEKDEG